MPNYCSNFLTVTGTTDEVHDFVERSVDPLRTFSLNALVPMPEDVFRGDLGEKERELYGKNNWYDWSVDNWGTKWDVTETSVWDISDVDGESSANITFETAWSPPVEWLKTVANEFEGKINFILEFCEEGMDYSGTTSIIDGVLTEVEGSYWDSPHAGPGNFIYMLSDEVTQFFDFPTWDDYCERWTHQEHSDGVTFTLDLNETTYDGSLENREFIVDGLSFKDLGTAFLKVKKNVITVEFTD